MMRQQTFSFVKKTAHAILSEDRVYRYALFRSVDGEEWDSSLARHDSHGTRRTVCFVMLNPSKADESANDPTIEKLLKFTARWGFQRLAVVNLFAYRETDSKKLRALASGTDLIGPENDQHIIRVAGEAHKIVCAWGNEGVILDRGFQVAKMLAHHFGGAELFCFKKSLIEQPVHPLYQLDAAELIPFL